MEQVSNAPTNMQEWQVGHPQLRSLLIRYKPRIFIAPGSYTPMNFYQDYLPNCRIRCKDKSKPDYGETTVEILRKIQFDTDYYLDFQIPPNDSLALTQFEISPTCYGRAYSDEFQSKGKITPLLFLKYSLVFPYSGLPAKLGILKNWGANLLGDPKAWHELDIHGAIHIILNGTDLKPLGILLAQHNHHRTFLVPSDFSWPEDDRVPIAIAKFSNEPYLMSADRPSSFERTVGNPFDLAYLLGRTNRAPIGSGFDKVLGPKEGAIEVDPKLEILENDDPLYTAWIHLGNRGKMLGVFSSWYKNGPPGMNYYTFPELKDLANLSAFSKFDPNDDGFFSLLGENMKSFDEYDILPLLFHQQIKFADLLDEARRCRGESN